MPRDNRIRIVYDSSGVGEARRDLRDLERAADRAGDEASELERKSRSASGSVRNLGASAARAAGLMAGASTAAIALAGALTFRQSIAAARVQEDALAQVRAGIEATGGAAQRTVSDIERLTGALQGESLFGDEQLQIAAANLLTFTNIVGDQFDETLRQVTNISERVGQDLVSTTIQLGKALNDPAANLGALSRTGIQFSESQKLVIQSLVETGRQAEAQTLILGELERQYGGAALAARETFGGAVQAASNAYGDLLEILGEPAVTGATDDINELVAILQDPQTQANARALGEALAGGLAGAVDALSTFIENYNAFVRFLENRGFIEPIEIRVDLQNEEAVRARLDALATQIANIEGNLAQPRPEAVQRQARNPEIDRAINERRAQQDATLAGLRDEFERLTDILEGRLDGAGVGGSNAVLETIVTQLGIGADEAGETLKDDAKEAGRALVDRAKDAGEALARELETAQAIRESAAGVRRRALGGLDPESRTDRRILEDLLATNRRILEETARRAEIDAFTGDEFTPEERAERQRLEVDTEAIEDALNRAFTDGAETLLSSIELGAAALGDVFDAGSRILSVFRDENSTIGDKIGVVGDSIQRFADSIPGPIGDVIGVVGSVASTVGSAVNFFKDLFGKPSDDAAGGGLDLNTGDTSDLFAKNNNAENIAARDALFAAAAEIAGSLADLTGAAFRENFPLLVQVGGRDGTRIISGGQDVTTPVGDADAAIDEIFRQIVLLLEGGETSLVSYARAAERAGDAPEDVIAGLERLAAISSLTADELLPVERQLQEIDNVIDPVVEDLERLGESIASVELTRSDLARGVGVNFLEGVEDEILALQNGTLARYRGVLRTIGDTQTEALALLERGAITTGEFQQVQFLNALRAQSFFENLSPGDLEQLGDFFGALESVAGEATVRLAQLTDGIVDFTDNIEETLETMRREADLLNRVVESGESTLERLRDQFSGLTGREQIGDLQGQVQNILNELRGGNIDAERIADLVQRGTQLSEQGVRASAEFDGPLPEFAETRDFFFNSLQEILDIGAGARDTRLSEIEAANESVTLLEGIRDELASPDPSLDFLQAIIDESALQNEQLRELIEVYLETARAQQAALNPAALQNASDAFFATPNALTPAGSFSNADFVRAINESSRLAAQREGQTGAAIEGLQSAVSGQRAILEESRDALNNIANNTATQ